MLHNTQSTKLEMKIAVIIVSYNFERWIDRCLGSLRASSVQADVIVVDNCSIDNTTSIIEHDYPEVTLIKNQKNLGFGQANNIGMGVAQERGCDAVLLLNEDAWIDEDVIGTLCDLSRRFPQYGILSPVHLTGDRQYLDQGFAAYAKLNKETSLQDYLAIKANTEIVELPFVNAAFWFIPIEALNKVGGFSPMFFMYGEDKDWVNRLRYHGYALGYCPFIFGCHDRAMRPVTHDAFMRSERVYFQSEYLNPNYSLLSAFSYGVLAIIKKSAKCLVLLKWQMSKDYLLYFFRLLGQSLSIIGERRRTKKH